MQPVGRREWHGSDGSLCTEAMSAAEQMDCSLAGGAGAVQMRMSLQFEFELHWARQNWARQLDWWSAAAGSRQRVAQRRAGCQLKGSPAAIRSGQAHSVDGGQQAGPTTAGSRHGPARCTHPPVTQPFPPDPSHASPCSVPAQVLYGVNQRLRVEDVDSPLVAQRPVKSVALVIVTGDRGLCGGYNK